MPLLRVAYVALQLHPQEYVGHCSKCVFLALSVLGSHQTVPSFAPTRSSALDPHLWVTWIVRRNK